MSRRRIFLLFLPALLIVLLAAALAWLLRSESGANWIWQRLAAAVPGQLQARQLTGDLRSGLTFTQVSYRDAELLVAADTVALRFDLDLWPPAVSVPRLRVGALTLQTAAAAADAAATPVSAWLPRLALPVPVEFTDVKVGRVTWSRAAAEPFLDVRGLALSGSWHRDLVLRDVGLEHDGSRWQADLRFGFEPPYRLELTAAGSTGIPGLADGDAPDKAHRFALRVEGSGDLQQSRWNLRVEEPEVVLTGDLRQLLTTPGWDLQLTSPSLSWPPVAAEPVLTLHDLSVSSYGTLADYGLEAEARIDGPGLPAAAARVAGAGDRAGLDLELLDLEGDALAADGSGRVDWAPAPGLRIDAAVSRFDPGPWLTAWNGAEPASGRLRLAWSGELLEFEIAGARAPGTLEALEATGSLDAAAGTVSADLAWQGLTWPPGATEPAVTSRAGRAALGGSLDAWTVRGELEVAGPDVPEGRLQVEGTGSREAMSLRIPRGEVLGGGLAGTLDVSWSPAVSWAATARLENVATAPLAPSFPGRLSGEVAVSGRPDPRELRIDIRQLTGTVRARPVRAQGRLELESGRLVARGLRIASGDSEVTADGHLDGPDGLAVTARIDSLSDLADGAAGSFAGRATVSLDPSRPVLRLDGEGRDLAWGETVIGRLTVSTEADGGERIRLELSDVELDGRRIESASVTSAGDRPLEQLQADVQFGEGSASLRAVGGLHDWRAPLQGGWRGRLEALRLDEPALGHVELQQPAELSLDAGGLTFAETCFDDSREGRLCVAAAWRPGHQRNVQASLDGVSPNLALSLLGSDLAFSQRLSGVAEWRQLQGGEPTARVSLDISPGEIGVRGEDEPILVTAAGFLGFEIAEGRLYSGNLDIPLAGALGIDTDFSVPDLSRGLESAVQGRLRIELESVEPLLRLLPGVEGSSGPLSADLRFSGTLANPQWTGHIAVVRGRIAHFASGLLLQDISLAGAVYQYDQTELSGTFRAGDGHGTIRTVLSFGDLLRPELLLEVKGEDLTLVNVPDLMLRADPDVRFTWREGVLTLGGRVLVRSARLSPRYLPTAAVGESPDVVIVAGVDPLAVEQDVEPVQRKIRGELEVELGNDVQLLLDEAKARFTGTALFRWDDALVPMASGSFRVSGEIHAYGQLLEVTEGRINFSNRPADNPFLNIRAEREIYGSTQVRRAGVQVTGTLREPVLEPYTTPMTTRERALTMLVTGSDFSSEQGTGSVEVGMYVAPKLYISYGIGLFDEQNVISARYDLGKGFGIKTTSGQRESGADISYTIER